VPNSEKTHKLPDADKQLKWFRRLQTLYHFRPEPVKWVLYLMVSLLVVMLIFYPREYLAGKKYQVGEVAMKTIKVMRDSEVQDRVTTAQQRSAAEDQARDVYDFDPALPESINQGLADMFAKMSKIYQSRPKPKDESITMPGAFKEETKQELLGLGINEAELDLLAKFYFDPGILSRLQKIVPQFYSQPVALDLSIIKLEGAKGIMVKNLQNGETTVLTNYGEIQQLSQLKKDVARPINQEFTGYPANLKNLLTKIVTEHLRPSLTFNKEDTEKLMADIGDAVQPVYIKFKKGEVIVRKGDTISDGQWKRITALQSIRSPFSSGFLVFGLMILITMSQFFIYNFAERNIRKFRASLLNLVFLSIMLLLSLLTLKIFEYIGTNIKESLSIPDGVNFYYLAGIAGSAMLVRMVLNSETAAIYTFMLAGFSGLVAGFDFYPVVFTMVGGLVAASEVGTCEQRSKIFRAGLFLGVVNLVLVLSFAMLQNSISDREQMLYNSVFAVAGGIFAAIVITGVTPAIESIFGYSTNIKLLELLNQEHPLLKELSLKASGTHQHSLAVANLAEAAAEAIGANPLFARVIAMYHDVGKMEMPNYFAENQWDQKNPHMKIKPTMSALILIKHAKEGVEMAEKYRLPEEVVHAIQQHHGTSLIKFFYEKAKETENPEVDTIDEQEFRYPGPKPQTREAGILMLADIVESAARTLREPNVAKIQGMVQNLVNRVFVDGQLDECELTLKDLHEISKAFVKVLGAMYHSRPEYPQPVEKGAQVAKKNGVDPNHEPTEAKNPKEAAPAKDPEVIKRLGN
jgi:cyclic-di-AMP phosphodiesterase PgpH